MAQIKKVILKDTMSGDQLFPATSIDSLYNTDGTKWTPPEQVDLSDYLKTDTANTLYASITHTHSSYESSISSLTSAVNNITRNFTKIIAGHATGPAGESQTNSVHVDLSSYGLSSIVSVIITPCQEYGANYMNPWYVVAVTTSGFDIRLRGCDAFDFYWAVFAR